MIRRNEKEALVALPALMALGIGCGPGTGPVGDDGGTGGSMGASLVTSPDVGTAFQCPEARWHEGSLVIDDSVDVDALRDIGGVTSNLEVRGTNILTDLEFLSCLQVVEGGVVIADNVALQRLGGLERLEMIGPLHENGLDSSGGLSIVGNQALINLLGLESLDRIGTVWVAGNPNLVSVGLPAVARMRLLELGECDHGSSNDSLSEVGDYPLLEYLRSVRVSRQSLTSLASLVGLAERGVKFEEASFERNHLLSTAEIEAFASTAGIAVEACENKDDEEMCSPCLSD